jgi:uncharacterized SAM-binding protein YcdF (DUF218 family)
MSAMKRCLLIIAAIHLLLLALVVSFLVGAAAWLRAPEAPAKSDVIVVLAGSVERAYYAADLYRQGFAPLVLVSRPEREAGQRMLDELGIDSPAEEDVNVQVLQSKGVPHEHIRVIGFGSRSTFEEALAVHEAIAGKPLRVMVVTSPYHVRRTGMIFRKILGDMPVELRIVGNTYEPFPEQWWNDQGAARNVVLESAKIAYYLLGGAFLSHEGAR